MRTTFSYATAWKRDLQAAVNVVRSMPVDVLLRLTRKILHPAQTGAPFDEAKAALEMEVVSLREGSAEC